MAIGRQTFFLLRKNFQIKRRHKRLTFQEIVVPIYWLLILVIIKLTTKIKVEPAIDSKNIPFQSLTVQGPPHGFANTTKLPSVALVTDGNPACEKVVAELKSVTSYRTKYIRFNTSDEMLNFYKKYGDRSNMGLGFVFQKDKQYGITYTIHVADGIVPKLTTKTIDRGKCRNMKNFYYNCPAFQYITSNIAFLQSVVDSAISKVLAGLPHYVIPNITIQMMPKGEFIPVNPLQTTVPIYMVLAFAPYITILLINLVDEKEQKQKELLRIMGMYDTAYWLSWFLTYAIILFFACLIINAIAIPTGIFGGSNFLVMFIVFFLFSLSLIMFAFMLTPLFKKSMSAGVVANLTTICFGVLIIPLGLPNVPQFGYWLGCLLSPTAFGLVLTQAVDTTGLQFDNLATKGNFPPAHAISMIIVDIFLYLLLALYLDAVIPAEYGKRRPPYFIFMKSFWKSVFCDSSSKDNLEMKRQFSVQGMENKDDIEPVGNEMIGKEAISIHKLRKVFPGKEEVVAVDDFSIDIYEGQVTALLGHNGAGKSTLIAALTGMIMPSSGTALIYGQDITDPEEMIQIRRNIGVCPQQDVVFNFISVREHLELYAGLKRVPNSEIKPMVDAVLKDIDLEDKADDIAKNLSGGQKRKLCVGIALMGNPKVLFLDEPTSGMDPHSRRSMWSLLQSKSKDRVVLLTTHFMDEADILADYKAIMSKGKLRCAGSSLFLKNRFGIGYHLNMAISEECDQDALQRLVKSKVEGAEVIRHHGRELAFSLPIEQVGNFAALFASLEDNNDSQEPCAASQLGVSSYGVSMTTLEEVFLQLEDTMDKGDDDNSTNNDIVHANTESLDVLLPEGKGSQSSNLHHTGVDLSNKKTGKLIGITRCMGQLQGMLKINWLNTIRSPLKIFFMIVLPPVLLVVGLVLMRNNNSATKYDLTPLQISPDLYLSPGSKEPYAVPLLFQNSTGNNVDDILRFLKDYKVGVDEVPLSNHLDKSSGSKPYWVLGLEALAFPHTKNISANPKLMSHFLLRFNDTMPHSIPVGVNLITSIFNMFVMQTNNQKPHPIRTTFKPLPNLKPKWTYDTSAFVSILLIGMGFVLFPGSFAILIVAQRQIGVRHLLRVSGLPSTVYWLYLFISDGILFVIPTVIMLIVIPLAGVSSLSSSAAMGCLVLSVALFIPSGTLFSYCMSFLFDKWETCQQVLPSVFSYAGILPFVAVSLVDMLANPDAAIIIHYVLCSIDPVYCLVGALYYINRIYLFETLTAQSNDITIPASTYFTWTKYNGIPAAWIAMFLQSVIFGGLLFFLDNRKAGVLCCKKNGMARSTSPSPHTNDQEEDVQAEKEKMAATNLRDPSSNSYSVAVKGLWKRFGEGKKQKMVVKDLSFGVQPGEVFGLLGPNGAGKTTTLNMITGAIDPSRGQMTVAGFNMSTHAYEIFQRMGYCPQTDALWPDITLEEHLACYAKVRGILPKDIPSTVNYFMSAMKVTEHAKKRSKALSGGTKRKLSFQIAMLGEPELLLLDEPSTGLDPSARRFLWNTISKNVCGDRGAILTTHSMEEADALSTRVGIMVKGEMKCLGSTQHLKSKYGSGYSLEIKLIQGSDGQSRLDDYVKQLFPGAILNETFGGKSTYKVPNNDVSHLSSIFAKLEEGKQTVGIEEYSFSQSTLEQVFLEFAREQDDDRTGQKGQMDELPPENGPQMA